MSKKSYLQAILIYSFFVCCSASIARADDIHVAVERGSVELVKAALKQNPQAVNAPRDDGMTPLHIAAKAGYMEVVDLLLAAGADVHAVVPRNQTALDIAVRSMHHDVVKSLIKAGALENHEDAQKVLHSAVYRDAAMTEILIIAGVDLNQHDLIGRTPLHTAVHYKKSDILELLIKAGADVNAFDRYGFTPLLELCKYDPEEEDVPAMVELARMLLRAGADPSITDEDGWTVLHFAVWFNLPDLVKVFIEEGLDTNARDRRKNTPLDLARQQKFKRIIEILEADNTRGR